MASSPIPAVVCFGLLIVLGIFIITYSVIRLAWSARAGTESNLSIPFWSGKKIELKGPAWLLLVGIGVLMVASPILAAFAQKPIDETIPPITVQRVQENERLPEENEAEFRFISDLSILDLRGSQSVPWYSFFRTLWNKGEANRTKPAVLRNVMTVRRVEPAPVMVISYSTSGDLVVRCLSHSATYQEKKVTQGGKTTDTWVVMIDVSTMPMNTDFELVIEATYFNGFSTPDESYYSTYANKQADSEDLSVLLIFPDDKPMKSLGVTEFPPNGGPGSRFTGIERVFPDPAGHSYFWTTTNTRSDYYYKLAWNW